MFRSIATAALVAAWTLAAPLAAQEEGAAPALEHVMTITARLGETVEVGETGKGMRRFIPITGGMVEGEGLSGTVRPGA